MTHSSIRFGDVTLQSVQLAISLRQIAREHPEATWNSHPNDIHGRTWGLMELADHLSAIHCVLGVIAETPNGYINQDALEGLRREFEPAIDFLETPWAKEQLEAIAGRLLS